MATIGSIAVAFEADSSPVTSAVTAIVKSLSAMSDAADGLREKLNSLSAISVSISVDRSSLGEASQEIDELRAKAAGASATVSVSADASGVERAARSVEDLGTAIESSGSVKTATSFLSRFGEVASAAMRRPADEAIRGSEAYVEVRDSAVGMGAVVQQSLRAVAETATTTAAAASGVSDAFSALAGGGSAGQFADTAIIAAGRVTEAYRQVRQLLSETIPGAFAASQAAIMSFAGTVGGAGTVMAAYRGSSAATAIVVGSLAGAVASAGAALVTYSAIMAAARVVFSGLSEEARGYAEAGTSVAAMFVSGAVASRVGTAAYQLVAAALFRSGTASEFFRRSVDLLSQATSRLLAPALQVVSVYTTLASIFGVASTAMKGFSDNNKKVSQTFSEIAGAVGRFAVTSVAIGAVAGGLNALRGYAASAGASMTAAGAGSAAFTGAMRGAAAAAGGLVTALPAVAAAISLAAVASGRFSKELEHLGAKAESIEQMADRFGSSNQQIEKIKTAAANANVSMMALVRSQQNFYSSLSKVKAGQFDSQSVREAKIAFDELGIPVEKLKSLKPEEAFKLVAKSLSEVKNAADKTRIAVDLFGARGAFALPALKEIGEVEEDFNRLGGAIRSVDFGNIMAMEKSFDRLKNASDALGRTMLVPFVSLQRAFNNFSAEVKGGLVAALAPLMTMLNDIAKPIAVIIEAIGRMINVTLRLIGIFTGIAAFFQIFATVGQVFEGIGEGFRAALAPLEALVEMFTSAGSEAGVFSAIASGVAVVLNAVGVAIGFVVGAAANLVVGVIAGAAAWGIYTAAVMLANATSITAAIAFATAWAAALAPIAVVIAILAALGAAVMAVVAVVRVAFGWFYSLGQAVGLVGKEREQIDATTVSTKELGKAAYEAQTASSWLWASDSENKITKSVDKSRDAFNNLVTESLKYGKAGSDSITSVQKRYADLEQSLADGKISAADFTKKTKDLFASASKGMKDYEQSAAVTLSKNLELYKRLDDGVRQVEKSIRDLSAGTVVDDKFFPASDEVKARAAQYKAEYVAAIEAIKKKQQSGGFQVELKQKEEQLSADLRSGKITKEQYASMKMELDSTNAQEQASIAAEGVQRELDRKTAKLKADISFADDLRKKLDEAFLSPVEKFQKELAKVKDNPSLSGAEKDSAEKMLRRDARESLVGKSAQQKLTERTRDVNQAASAGLISGSAEAGGGSELSAELRAAVDEFSSAVGIAKTPFEEFSSRLNSVTKEFGFAGKSLEEVRRHLSGNAEQLALFERAVQDARDSLLQSLGIEKSPDEVFNEQMKKISEAANSSDPNMRITGEQADQARAAAVRKRDASFGINEDISGQIADRRKQIEQAYGDGKDPAKFAAAMAKATDDLAASIGVTKTPFEQFSSSMNDIAGKFGMAGRPLEEVREKLKGTPEQLALFDRAVRESRDNLLQSLGIEKSPQAIFDEQMKKIDEAVNAADPNKRITKEQADEARTAATRARDSAIGAGQNLSGQFSDRRRKIEEAFGAGGAKDPEKFGIATRALDRDKKQAAGLDLTAGEQMQAGIDKINDAFSEAERGTAEYQEAIKKNKEAAMALVGVEKPAIQTLVESQKKLDQAVKDNVISAEQAAEASRKLADDFMSAIGVTKTPIEQASDQIANIAAQFGMAGKPIEQIRAALAGTPEKLALFERALKETRDSLLQSLGIEKTPQQKFEETMKKIDEAAAKGPENGGITEQEAARARINATRARNAELGGETANDRAGKFAEQRKKIEEAFGRNGERNQEAFAAAMNNLKKQGPGAEPESPVKKFQESLKELEMMRGSLDAGEFEQRKKNLQAQLQEDLKPALDNLKPDRRAIESSDTRSKAGVDTFFRILRGRDNPGLKAQLDTARNTRVIAEALQEPDAAPVIAQLAAR